MKHDPLLRPIRKAPPPVPDGAQLRAILKSYNMPHAIAAKLMRVTHNTINSYLRTDEHHRELPRVRWEALQRYLKKLDDAVDEGAEFVVIRVPGEGPPKRYRKKKAETT